MGKTYLITGGTDGIGKAIVKKILAVSEDDNDVIYVNYGHNEEKAKALISEIDKEQRHKLQLVKADMGSEEGLESLFDHFQSNDIFLDHIVLNVGISQYAKFDDYTFDMWNKIMQTNLTVPVFLLQKFKNRMNQNGSVLLMGSYAGRKEYSSSVVYSISKAGVVFLAKVLVKELESKGIRINAVAPGFIDTSWQASRAPEVRERIEKKIALHRFGTPEEVADITVSVLLNTYMNGAIIDIHGGYEYF